MKHTETPRGALLVRTCISLLAVGGLLMAGCSSSGGVTDPNGPPTAVAPQISTHPADRAVAVGESATFSVAATGTAPLTYQWRRNGTVIGGATGASHVVGSAAVDDHGAEFTVAVTNAAGSVTSNGARLTVSSPPPGSPGTITPMIVAGGLHTLALTSDGVVYSWGSNAHLALGRSGNNTLPAPVTLALGGPIVQVAAAQFNSMALRADGRVFSWGQAPAGDGWHLPRFGMAEITDVVEIASGNGFGMALKSDGTVWEWGQLGFTDWPDGSRISLTPVKIPDLPVITRIEAGANWRMALDEDGAVYTWGANHSGQLGLAGGAAQAVWQFRPVKVTGAGYEQIVGGNTTAFVIAGSGGYTRWGWNPCMQGTMPAPGGGGGVSPPPPGSDGGVLPLARTIAAGYWHTLAIRSNGDLLSWGCNNHGQLGNGTTTSVPSYTTLASLTGVTSISAGAEFSVAVREDGSVWTWGINSAGQLGDGTTVGRLVPGVVPGFVLK